MTEDGRPEEREEHGQGLLARLSNEMVRAQKQFFGKGPTGAKSYLLDDLLIIVMRGGLTTASASPGWSRSSPGARSSPTSRR
ncbi:MAG: DUF2294 family protein [Chloroflexi bacterium]|nr:DUF2294 family protein [Chloroflexota bacterium]